MTQIMEHICPDIERSIVMEYELLSNTRDVLVNDLEMFAMSFGHDLMYLRSLCDLIGMMMRDIEHSVGEQDDASP